MPASPARLPRLLDELGVWAFSPENVTVPTSPNEMSDVLTSPERPDVSWAVPDSFALPSAVLTTGQPPVGERPDLEVPVAC